MRRCLLPILFAALGAWPSAAPARVVLPTSRPADPAGRVTSLQAFPTGVAVSPDGKTLLAVAGAVIQGGAQPPDPLPEVGVQLYVIDPATGAIQTVPTGPHPTDVAVEPGGHVAIADANDATVARFAPGDTTAQSIDVAQIGRRSDSPNALVAAPGGRVYVSLADDDAVAVLAPRSGSLSVIGLIPTGWYPDALALSPDGRKLYVV